MCLGDDEFVASRSLSWHSISCSLYSVSNYKRKTQIATLRFFSSSSTPPRSLAIPFRSFILSRCLGLFNHEARERTTQLFYNRVFVFHYFLALHYSRQHQSSSPTAAAAHRHLNKKSKQITPSVTLSPVTPISRPFLVRPERPHNPILNRNTRIGSSVGERNPRSKTRARRTVRCWMSCGKAGGAHVPERVARVQQQQR